VASFRAWRFRADALHTMVQLKARRPDENENEGIPRPELHVWVVLERWGGWHLEQDGK
jgi:hypothetical protein